MYTLTLNLLLLTGIVALVSPSFANLTITHDDHHAERVLNIADHLARKILPSSEAAHFMATSRQRLATQKVKQEQQQQEEKQPSSKQSRAQLSNEPPTLRTAPGSASKRPSWEPVFYIFSLAALVCFCVILHIVYLEWREKQTCVARCNADVVGSYGAASDFALELRREYTQPGGGGGQLSASLNRSFAGASTSPAKESPQPGLIAFESVTAK